MLLPASVIRTATPKTIHEVSHKLQPEAALLNRDSNTGVFL